MDKNMELDQNIPTKQDKSEFLIFDKDYIIGLKYIYGAEKIRSIANEFNENKENTRIINDNVFDILEKIKERAEQGYYTFDGILTCKNHYINNCIVEILQELKYNIYILEEYDLSDLHNDIKFKITWV